MAKSNNKQRAGLQKKVSSVFKGVPIPGANRAGRPLRRPAQEDTAASSPPMPGDNQVLSDPVAKKIDRREQPTDRTVPERLTVSAPPMSTDTKSPPSPEVKKLIRPDESADKAVPECASVSAPPMSTDTKSPPSPEVKKLVRPDESADKAVPEHAAALPKPVSTNHQGSQSTLLKRNAQCEESSGKPARAETEAPSHKPAQAKTEEPSYKPAKAKAEESSYKPAPVKQHQDDVFAEAGGLSLCQQMRDKLAASKLGAGSAKDKVMVMLVPVLAIVMIFMFRQVLRKSPGKAQGAAKDEAPVAVTTDSGDEIEWELPEPLPAIMRDPLKLPSHDNEQSQDPDNNDNTHNPEQSSTTGEAETTVLRIRGIVYSEDKPSVVIGNTIAHVGTTINGVTVVRINRNSVELEKDGETWVQTMHD